MTDPYIDKCFKSHAEMWNHLLDGGEIQLHSDPTVRAKLDENGVVLSPYNVGAFGYWMPYVEPKWYDNIPPQGILCICQIGKNGKIALRNILSYSTEYNFHFIDDWDNHWEHAEPATFEEVVERIYKPSWV